MWGTEDLKAFVQLADESRVPYFITGGVALDALPERGRLTRQHGDVNVLLPETGVRDFKNVFGDALRWYENIIMPRGEINSFTIELWPYTLAEGSDNRVGKPRQFFVVNGEKNTRWYPIELVDGQVGRIGSLDIRIARNEQLRYDCLPKATLAKHPEDQSLFEAIASRMDWNLFYAIKNLPAK